MTQFIKHIYLTGYVLAFRLSRSKDFNYRAGGAIALLALVEFFVILGIDNFVEVFQNKKVIFSQAVIYLSFFALAFANWYVLVTRRHGVEFEREFHRLAKSKRIALVVSCAVVLVATIVFGIHSITTYRHFFHIHNPAA